MILFIALMIMFIYFIVIDIIDSRRIKKITVRLDKIEKAMKWYDSATTISMKHDD